MKGYGVYCSEKSNIMYAWFAEKVHAEKFSEDFFFKDIRPVEIGILQDIQPMAMPIKKPYDPSIVPVGKTLSTDKLTKEDLEKAVEELRKIGEPGMVIPQDLKLGHCGKYCNGCDYSTPQGDCVLGKPETAHCTKCGKEVDTATMIGDGLCNECYTSEVNNKPEAGYTNSEEVISMENLEYKIAKPNVHRAEWLAENPLQIYLRRHDGLGYIGMSKALSGKISPMRLQKLAIGIEEPDSNDYEFMGEVMDRVPRSLQVQWEHWLMRIPEHI